MKLFHQMVRELHEALTQEQQTQIYGILNEYDDCLVCYREMVDPKVPESEREDYTITRAVALFTTVSDEGFDDIAKVLGDLSEDFEQALDVVKQRLGLK